MHCIAYENTVCAFLRTAVTTNDNTAWKGLGIANYYQKSQSKTEWVTPKIFMFVLVLPLRTPLLCGCRKRNVSDASHIYEEN